MHAFRIVNCFLVVSIAQFIGSLPAWAILPSREGLLNAVTGEVLKDGIRISNLDVGAMSLLPGDNLRTRQGMTEVLPAPGCFLRLGDTSELSVVSPAPRFRTELKRGEAMLQILRAPAEPVIIEMNAVTITMQRAGLYDLNRNRGTVEVFRGRAIVSTNDKRIVLDGGEGIRGNRPRKFPAMPNTLSDLYIWSAARASHLSYISEELARAYGDNRRDWHGPDWYWDPFWNCYSFVPDAGSRDFRAGGSRLGDAPGNVLKGLVPHHGDSLLYGPPTLPGRPESAPYQLAPPPSVPLTGPGIPTFPNSRSGGGFGGGGFTHPW